MTLHVSSLEELSRIRRGQEVERRADANRRPKKLEHKFRAKPTERDGWRFDSRLEARYYDKLMLAKQSGELLFFLRQVPFHLPGGVVLRVDFQEFWADGSVVFTDTKGVETESFKAKRRIVETLYPVQINLVKKHG